jgi:hypothetical protein
MGAAYRLDHVLGLTLTVFDGTITGDEWRATARTIFADPAWPPGPLNLTDLRTADASALTDADRVSILAINASHADQLAGMKSAAVGGTNFEIAARFQREDEMSGLRLVVFDDLPPACTWLGVDADAVSVTIRTLREQLRDQ